MDDVDARRSLTTDDWDPFGVQGSSTLIDCAQLINRWMNDTYRTKITLVSTLTCHVSHDINTALHDLGETHDKSMIIVPSLHSPTYSRDLPSIRLTLPSHQRSTLNPSKSYSEKQSTLSQLESLSIQSTNRPLTCVLTLMLLVISHSLFLSSYHVGPAMINR